MELWGSSQTLTASGSRGIRVLRIPVCSCPLSFSSALSPALLFSFFCYSVLPNTPLSCHLFHCSGGNICFGYELGNYFHVPEFGWNFLPDSAVRSKCVTAASPIIPVKQEPVWFPSVHEETTGDPALPH